MSATAPTPAVQAVLCQCVYAVQVNQPCTARATVKRKKSGLNFCSECKDQRCRHVAELVGVTLGHHCMCPTGQHCVRTPLMQIEGMPVITKACDPCRLQTCEHRGLSQPPGGAQMEQQQQAPVSACGKCHAEMGSTDAQYRMQHQQLPVCQACVDAWYDTPLSQCVGVQVDPVRIK
jgi:hypothetical protein